VIPSCNDTEKQHIKKYTNTVPREVRQYCSFWHQHYSSEGLQSASKLYLADARDRFLERVRRILNKNNNLKEDLKWIGLTVLGNDSLRPPQSWIDAGFVFNKILEDSWQLICPALRSALSQHASNEGKEVVGILLSDPHTKGEGLELAFTLSFQQPTVIQIPDHSIKDIPRGPTHRIAANRFSVLPMEQLKTTTKNPVDWEITLEPGVLYRMPLAFPGIDFVLVTNDDSIDGKPSKKLLLFSFSFQKYNGNHVYSLLFSVGSKSSLYYGNILQRIYKAAFGENPSQPIDTNDKCLLPCTTFFFCTPKIGPQTTTDDHLVDVCLVDGSRLYSLMDNRFVTLITNLVDRENFKTTTKKK